MSAPVEDARAEAVIDLDRLSANLASLRTGIPGVAHMVVVKADAYGHGAVAASRTARAAGAEWLGVALPTEALRLRAAGDEGPILAWLCVPGDPALEECVAAGVDLGVGSRAGLDAVAAMASRAGLPARVHLKVDSGLGRGGCTPAEWAGLVSASLAARNAVRVDAIWSHLACGDEPAHPSIDEQLGVFTDAIEEARALGLEAPFHHLAASGAALSRPDTRFDMVRLGIAAYGLSPGPQIAPPWPKGLDIGPVMTLRARVAAVKRVPQGHGVSYGLTWRAPRETSLALVPLGYADGIPRGAHGASVLIGAARYPVVGRVAMDQFVVDVGDDDVAPGDDVVVFDAGVEHAPTADEWAGWCDTIGYEIVTRIGPRVPRRYVGGPS
ncbi:MAG: alanine racemase [bacterium]